MIDAIGFDIDHTLAIDNKVERVAFMRLGELLQDHGGKISGNLDDESRRIDELLRVQREGECTIAEAVRRFVQDRGVEHRDFYVERFRTMAVEMCEVFVIPIPGVKPTLQRLRERGITLAVLSNGWNPLQVKKAQRVGFEGPVLASADIGAQKPDGRAFEALLKALGTSPQETWYVGDNPRGDVQGAREAGLQAVWFNWEKKIFPVDLEPPPHTIGAIEELLDLLPTRTNV